MFSLCFGIVGAAVGSFLNVCIDRLPSGYSISYPPSHCPACGRRLAARDLFPILSYLSLGGRCRYCGDAIPWRVLAVEVTTGLIFAMLWRHYGMGIPLILALVYCCFLIVVAFIDLEHQIIPSRVIYPAIVVAMLGALITPGRSIWNSLGGGLVGFGILFLIAFVNPAGMGMGDVRLAAFMGLIVGFPGVLVSLLIGVVAGGLAAAFLLLAGLKGRRDSIPFGPFLVLGAIVTLLYGAEILHLYVGL